MPTIPNGFKPVIQGYGIGSPTGVMLTEVAGGMPRSAMEWDRGVQPFQVTFVLTAAKFAVWTAFFHHVIKKGAIAFTMPLDSGFGLQDHECLMVPGSYSAARAGGQITSVTFTVVAESSAYAMTAADADAIVELWNEYGEASDELLARIAQFANEDTLVLQ
jgi:hypothetical protein